MSYGGGINPSSFEGKSIAIQQTFSGSTVVRIFDDSPKVTRPQMPMSFVTDQSNPPVTGNSYDILPPLGGRKGFRFYSVRASKIGSPIAITIEPPNNATDASNALVPANGMTANNFVPGPLPLAFTNEGYAPYPPQSPQTPMEIYAPRSFQEDERYVRNSKRSSRNLNDSDDNSSTSSSSSSSSSSDSEEAKKMFHYLEFAIVSALVNPIFGIVAITLSCKYFFLYSFYKNECPSQTNAHC